MATLEEIKQRLRKTKSGCLLWTGAIDSKGYGRVSYNGKLRGVHQVMYEAKHGPVPKGLELDHIVCSNEACANEEHLKPVTHKQNMLRGTNPCAMKARQTTCVKGHPLSGNNLYVKPDGRRVCRICAKEYQTLYRIENGRPWG